MHGSESQMGNLFFIQPVWAIEVPSSCTCQWKHSSLAAKPNVQTTLYSLTFARLMSAFRTWKPIFLSFLGCTKFRQKVAWYIHIYIYIYAIVCSLDLSSILLLLYMRAHVFQYITCMQLRGIHWTTR